MVEAKGRCPPKDPAGLSGYEHVLETIAKPGHLAHDEPAKWHGGPFDALVRDFDFRQLEVLKRAKEWQPRKKQEP